MIANNQIFEASVLGTLAFKNGIKRSPALDKELKKFFVDRKIGETPEGEASSIDIMKAWTNSWDAANLSKKYISQKVQIDNFLTNDPKNKQGEKGTIISINEIDEDNADFTIKFEDGVIGVYQQGTFQAL